MPLTPTHPGEILKEALEERHMSQTEFARRMGVSTKHVNEIINGHTGYSTEFALGMERVLRINARFWMGALAEYETEVLRAKLASEGREARGGPPPEDNDEKDSGAGADGAGADGSGSSGGG